MREIFFLNNFAIAQRERERENCAVIGARTGINLPARKNKSDLEARVDSAKMDATKQLGVTARKELSRLTTSCCCCSVPKLSTQGVTLVFICNFHRQRHCMGSQRGDYVWHQAFYCPAAWAAALRLRRMFPISNIVVKWGGVCRSATFWLAKALWT